VNITRRQTLAAAGALALRPPIQAAFGPAPSEVRNGEPLFRTTLDLGHRGTRGGPLATLKDGSMLWAVTEPEAPYLAKEMWSISRVTMRRSHDGGRSWRDPAVAVRGTTEYSVLSHALRVTSSGTLLHIYVRYSGYDYASPVALVERSLCEAFIQRSNDGGKTWREEKKLPTNERYIGDVLSMEQLRDGRLIYPFCFLTSNQAQFAVSVLYSDDDGRNWSRSSSVLEAGGSGFESGASEPTVVELADGRLWMLLRAQTGFLWQSYSTDRGQTWSKAAPSSIPSSNAPATMLRLKSGKIAVAWNNHVAGNYARQSLVLGITTDGKTFECARELDGTDFPDNDGEQPLHTTYGYLTAPDDHTITVSYNKGHWMRHNRPALALVPVSWLTAREDLVDFRDGRTGWRTVNPGSQRRAAIERYARDARDSDSDTGLSLEIEQAKGVSFSSGISRNIPQVRKGEIRATITVLRPDAYLMMSDTLLVPGDVGEGCIRIRFAAGGKVYLAAGAPTEVSRDRRTTKYSYLKHAAGTEIEYPRVMPLGARTVIATRYDAEARRAEIRIGNGPAATLETGRILGLGWLGLAVHAGGVLRILSIETKLA
jgi:hypothetical protein